MLFENTPGRYLKLEAVNSWIGNGTLDDVRTSIAEIRLRGTTESLGTELIKDEISIHLYPNPSSDILNIESSSDHITQVAISNIEGSVLKSFSMYGSKKLDVTDLSPGMYLVKLHTSGKIILKKLLII